MVRRLHAKDRSAASRVVRWVLARKRLEYELAEVDDASARELARRFETSELPLLEDVEFVRRLAGAGAVAEVQLPLRTSARRWRRDGWFRRSARNTVIVSCYFAGVSPERLARWYGS